MLNSQAEKAHEMKEMNFLAINSFIESPLNTRELLGAENKWGILPNA